MRDVTGGFRAVPDGLFRKRIARLARNCPFRHHYLFFFEVLTASELEDAGQLKHVLSAEVPEIVEYLPAMQPVQELSAKAPGVVEYLPAPQSMQELATVAPVVVEYLPASQSMHEAAPVTVLNFPAPHATHVPPCGPVWPALH